MIVLAEDKESGAQIFKWAPTDYNPIFRIEVGKNTYSHSVQGFDTDSYQWYCEVMGRQLNEAYELGLHAGKKEVRDLLKQAIGK